jgi:hypothetical protein
MKKRRAEEHECVFISLRRLRRRGRRTHGRAPHNFCRTRLHLEKKMEEATNIGLSGSRGRRPWYLTFVGLIRAEESGGAGHILVACVISKEEDFEVDGGGDRSRSRVGIYRRVEHDDDIQPCSTASVLTPHVCWAIAF